MKIPSLELRGPDDRVAMGMPVDPLLTGSNFSSGLSSPVVFLVFKLIRKGITFQDGTIYPQKFRKKIFRKFTVFSQTIMGLTHSGLARPVPIRVVFSTPGLAG